MINSRNNKSYKLTLGTVQIGLQYGVANRTGKPKCSQALEMLRYAMEHGICSLDTAQAYGDSEDIIGQFITEQKLANKKLPKVTTKLLATEMAETATDCEIYNQIKDKLKVSLDKLHVESLDSCLLHSPLEMVSHQGKIVSALLELKKQGLINRIGVSVYTPDEVEKFLDYQCFDVIQVPLNIFDHRLIESGLLERLAHHGVEVYARSIYLQGLFFLNPSELPSCLQIAARPIKMLRELALETGITVPELAMVFIRDLPGVKQLVVGCENLEQLKFNLRIINSPELSDHIIHKIRNLFLNLPERLINPSLWVR